MDDLIAKLRARREHLAAELNRIEGAITKHEEVAAEIAELLSTVEISPEFGRAYTAGKPASEPVQTDAVKPEAPRRVRGPKGSSPEDIAEAADLIIRERGRAMTRFELLEPVESMGLTIGGHDKARNLGTILWRSGRFDSTGEGYWPKDVNRGIGRDLEPVDPSGGADAAKQDSLIV